MLSLPIAKNSYWLDTANFIFIVSHVLLLTNFNFEITCFYLKINLLTKIYLINFVGYSTSIKNYIKKKKII